MLNFTRLTCALAVTALALSAQVTPVSSSQTVETTGMVGFADTQTAQLNLLNVGVPGPGVTAAICAATVTFLDANGTVLKTGVLTAASGRSSALVLHDTDLKLTSNERREIRATIATLFPPPPAANATTPIVAGAVCKLIPTLEIFDTATGRTLVTLGHVIQVPGPTPTTLNNP